MLLYDLFACRVSVWHVYVAMMCQRHGNNVTLCGIYLLSYYGLNLKNQPIIPTLKRMGGYMHGKWENNHFDDIIFGSYN